VLRSRPAGASRTRQWSSATARLDETQQAELELRKSKMQLKTSKQELELSVQRRVDEEQETIRATPVGYRYRVLGTAPARLPLR
jgi:hypothetical protein